MTLEVGDWVLLPDGRIRLIEAIEENDLYTLAGQEAKWRGEGLRFIHLSYLKSFMDARTKIATEIEHLESNIADLQIEIAEKRKTVGDEMNAIYNKMLVDQEWAEATHNGQWEEKPVVRGTDSIQWLFPLLANRGFIGGSYAAFCVSPLTCPILPNDIDIFCMSAAAQKDLRGELEGRGYLVRDITAVAITLEGQEVKDPTIQLVAPHPQWKEFPRDILNSFDLNVCRAILLNEVTVLADKEAGMMKGRILRLNDPLRTLARVVKYQARGVRFSEHELLKLFRAWADLPKAKQDEQTEEARRQEQGRFAPIEEDYTFDCEDDYWEGEGEWEDFFEDDWDDFDDDDEEYED